MRTTFNIVLAIIILLGASLNSFGQETLTIHHDKPYYASGEAMWYKVYLPSYFSENDVTFKVIVSDKNGTKKDSYFIKSKGEKHLIGYYKFPYQFETNVYQFHFYALTKISQREVVLTSFEVPYYDDLSVSEKDISTNTVESPTSTLMADNSNINLNIKLSKQSYIPGEEVKLQISATNNEGSIEEMNYSVAVVDEKLIGSAWSNHVVQSSSTTQLDEEVVQYLDDNLYVIGQVLKKDGSPRKVNQLGVFDGTANQMHLARTDTEGNFALFLPGLYGDRKIQFAGYISNEAPDIKVNLKEDQQGQSNSELIIDTDILNYVKNSSLRKKIYQYYKTLEYDLNTEMINEETRNTKADKLYDLSKFVQFKTVGSFMNEIISAPLKFDVDNDQVTAKMFDPQGFKRYSRKGGSNDNFPFTPVFIIDDKLTKDAKFVYNMDLNGVETIELFNSIKSITDVFGNFRNYGVVRIKTSLPDVKVPEEDAEDIYAFKGLQPKADFLNMKSLTDKNIPQFRPLVYWNPDISSTQTQKANIIFNASEDISDFKIIVVGQSKDGSIVKGSASYSNVLNTANN